MGGQKLVSVIITTHNRAEILPRAIESVLSQTYENVEIIIVNDGSEDNTESVIQSYLNNPSIKCVYHKVALGGNVARNNGIKIAKGEFIAGLDDDDEFTPDRIEELIKNQNDKYSLITSDDIMVCGKKIINKTNKPEVITLQHMLKENVVGNQVLIRKARLLALNAFDEELTASQDYDMWLRVIQKYGDAYVVKKGLQKIYVSNEINRISSVGAKKFSGYFSFYKKHKKLFSKNDRKQQLARLYKTRNKKMSYKTLCALFSIYSIKQYIKFL